MSLNTHYFATFRVRISYASYLRVIKRSPSINSLVSVGSIDSCRLSLYINNIEKKNMNLENRFEGKFCAAISITYDQNQPRPHEGAAVRTVHFHIISFQFLITCIVYN